MQKSDDTLTARVTVPQSKSDPSDVKFEEIPLPPRELWGDSATAAAAGASTEVSAPVLTTGSEREIEALDFLLEENSDVLRNIPLKFPFNWQGGPVRTIAVRRLTTGEVGNIIDKRPANVPDNFDIYGAMTGLPASVLRGLISDDGEVVAEACYDFLPRYFRPAETDQPASS